MPGEPGEGMGSVLRQALISGAIVGVILVTVVAAILLTNVVGGSDADSIAATGPTIVGEVLSPTPIPEAVTDTPLPIASATNTLLPPPSATSTETEAPATLTNTPTPSATSTEVVPTATPAITAPAGTLCPPPVGWQAYLVQPGDTVASLAEQSGVSEETLREANCLGDAPMTPGQIVFLTVSGDMVTRTPAVTPCVPPAGWVRYTVRPGDTLVALAAYCGMTVESVMRGNCLTETVIYVGTTLYLPCVPSLPTPAPWPTAPVWTPAPWPTVPAWTIAPWTPAPTPTSGSVIPPLSTPTRQPAPSTQAPPPLPPTTSPPYIPPLSTPTRPPAPPTTSPPYIPPLSTPTRPPTP